MNNIINFFLTFLCLNLYAATPNVAINIESFNKTEQIKNLQETFFEKRITHKPEFLVNPNIGSFQSSFKIDLPKNKFLTDGIYFDYNSNQIQNYGYGVGFSLRISRIIYKNNKIFYQDSGLNELVKINNNGTINRKRIKILENQLQREIKIERLFRLKDENSFSLFAQDKEWVYEFKTDGQTFIFNSKGLLEQIIDLNGTMLNLKYFESRLIQVVDEADSFEVSFSYLENESMWTYLFGKFELIPRGLREITVSQGNSKRIYSFTYKEDLLIEVIKSGAFKKVFLAEYDDVPVKFEYINKKVENSKNKIVVFKNRELNPEFIELEKDSKTYYVDFNNDGVTDEISLMPSFSDDVVSKKIKEILGDLQINCDKEIGCGIGVSQGELDSRLKNIKDYLEDQKYRLIFRYGSVSDDKYRVDVDSSLDFTFPISKLGHYTVRFIKNPGYKLDISFEKEHELKFYDVDDDGNKDLLFVSSEVDKKFSEKIKTQDPLVQSAFNLLKNKKLDNIFNYEGEIPEVYLLKTNESKALAVLSKNPFITFVKDISSWEKTSVNFKMHTQSIYFDYNHDGIVDIMTGKRVYLLGLRNEVKVIPISDKEILNMFDVTTLTQEHLDQSYLVMVDDSGKGIWHPYNADNSYVSPKDRRLHLFNGQGEYLVQRPTIVPLIKKLTSDFGGSVDVTYRYKDGVIVVQNIKHSLSDSEQNNWIDYYQYGDSKWNLSKNIFLGFESATIETVLIENKLGKRINNTNSHRYEFDIDDQYGVLFWGTRARRGGRILKESVKDNGNIIKNVKNIYADHVFGDTRSFGYVKLSEEHTISQMDSKTKYEFVFNEDDLPMSVKKTQSDVSDNYDEVQTNTFNKDLYLIRGLEKYSINRIGQKRVVEFNQFNNDGDLVGQVTPKEEKTILYDSLKRPVLERTSNGKQFSYTYLNSTSLVSKYTSNDLKVTYTYSDIENEVASMRIENGDTVSFRYSTDGILTFVSRNDIKLLSLNRLDKNRFHYKMLDQEYHVSVDGFGRIQQLELLGEEENVILFKKSFDHEDRIIGVSSPMLDKSGGEWNYEQTKFDFLGNKISQEVLDQSSNLLESFDFKYETCIRKLSNLKREDVVCRRNDQEVDSTSIPNEKVNFKYLFKNEISNVGENDFVYLRNDTGDIEKVSSKFLTVPSRIFDYQNNSVQYSDGVLEIKTPFGEMLKYQNTLNLEDRVEISNSYVNQLLINSNLKFGRYSFSNNYNYDSSRRLISKSLFGINFEFNYDKYDRLVQEKISDSKHQYSLNYQYQNGLVVGIKSYISQIHYNALLKPSSVTYENGLNAEYEYGPRGELKSVIFTNGYEIIYKSIYSYRTDLKLTHSSQLLIGQFKSIDEEFNYTDLFEYSEPVSSSYKNANDEFVFEYHHNDVVKMTRGENVWRNFYQDHHFLGSCDQKSNCFFKLSDDEISINGEIQKLIKIADVPVGLIYQGHFYPVIIDHKKALIGLISEDGLQIKFLRQTTAWGEDKGTIGDKKFESQIAFGYSHLLKNPLIEKVIPGKLYFSGTRVYLSSKGEWLTADNTILWNPEKLVNLPGNWNPYRYANNDPVNFVDPSGLFAIGLSNDFSWMLGIGGGKSVMGIISVDLNPFSASFADIEFGIIENDVGKIGIGLGVSVGTSLNVFIGNSGVKEIIESGPWGLSAELNVGLVGLGGSCSYGKGVFSASAGIKGAGFGLSAFSGLNYSNSSTVLTKFSIKSKSLMNSL